jgi:hypothetical protein
MSKLRCHISISLDGFVAGPNQSEENPLGESWSTGSRFCFRGRRSELTVSPTDAPSSA